MRKRPETWLELDLSGDTVAGTLTTESAPLNASQAGWNWSQQSKKPTAGGRTTHQRPRHPHSPTTSTAHTDSDPPKRAWIPRQTEHPRSQPCHTTSLAARRSPPPSQVAPRSRSSRPALATFPGRNGLIAFYSDTDAGAQIFTVRPNGHDLRQITHVNGDAVRPDWSPDGRRIAFELDTPDSAASRS